MDNIKYNVLDLGVTATGLTYSIANIKEILGLIILILTIMNILYKLIISIYNRVKAKRFDLISKDIENAKEDLEEINENIKGEK